MEKNDSMILMAKSDVGPIYKLYYELNLFFGTCFVLYSESIQVRGSNHWFWSWCRKLTIYALFMEAKVLLLLCMSCFYSGVKDIVFIEGSRKESILFISLLFCNTIQPLYRQV